jgi:hypothetical protein
MTTFVVVVEVVAKLIDAAELCCPIILSSAFFRFVC